MGVNPYAEMSNFDSYDYSNAMNQGDIKISTQELSEYQLPTHRY